MLSVLDDHIKILREVAGIDSSIHGTFYYDETNIFHKLRLTENGTNNNLFEQSFFGLGGIYIDRGKILDTTGLITLLKPQKTTTEFKYKYFSYNNTDVSKALDSNRFLILLNWLDKNDVSLHFTLMDYLYYGISDIIDSMPDVVNTAVFNRAIKSTLYDVVRSNSDIFLDLFYKYNYPDVARDKINEFVTTFYDLYINLVEYDNSDINDFPKELLRQMIKSSKSTKEMVFIHDNVPLELFKEYAHLYLDRPVRFPSSNHIFDEVKEITDALVDWDSEYEKKLNAKFINSKDSIFVQLSDALIGLISRVSNLILNMAKDDIKQFVSGLNSNQLRVLQILYKRINTGARKSIYFNQFIGSDSFIAKQQYFINLISSKVVKL